MFPELVFQRYSIIIRIGPNPHSAMWLHRTDRFQERKELAIHHTLKQKALLMAFTAHNYLCILDPESPYDSQMDPL